MDLREQIRVAIGGALAAQEGSDGAADAVMEVLAKQEPFDADSDVFRSAFEAALKAGNWPATRQGDGYRSPSTQIAWRIAFSTVNRLKLYLAPGAQAQPAPSVPVAALRPVIDWLRNGCDPQEAAKELEILIAAAPEAKP